MIFVVPIVGIFHQQNLLSSPVVTQLRAFIDPGIVLSMFMLSFIFVIAARLDQVMGSEPLPFDNWISNDNIYINKPTQTGVHTKRPHAITKMNDNINMDSTIPGSMNARSWVTTGEESRFCWWKIPTIGTTKIIEIQLSKGNGSDPITWSSLAIFLVLNF
jgi:hypothetical protein